MNKSNLFIIIIFYSLILFHGCTPDNKTNQFELVIVKKITLTEDVDRLLPRMYSTVLDNPNKSELAFSNYRSPMGVIITGYDGKLVEKIGVEGRGPGEIQSSRYFGFDGHSNIVILDKVSASFVLYNRKTKETKSFVYPIKKGVSVTSRNMEFCEGFWYLGMQLLGKPTQTDVPTIAVFDSLFTLIDSLGGYDPFFNGRSGIMRETEITVDCKQRIIFTTQSKVPYIQVFSMDDNKYIGRTIITPPSFMLSDKFYDAVFDPREWTRFLSEEQSLSLRLAYSEKYIFHIFRNENNEYTQPKYLNDSNYFVAVYDKQNLEYLGEIRLPGAALGYTKNGNLIILADEINNEIHFIKIKPITPID